MIIGSSGSGKTVFLKCLLGLFSPDAGDICYDERHYREMSLKEKRELRKEIGMVFQGGALFDSETIEDNIKFPLKMFSDLGEEEMRDRVNFVLKRVKLDPALVSSPLLTTVTDMCGFFFVLSFAATLLPKLGGM